MSHIAALVMENFDLTRCGTISCFYFLTCQVKTSDIQCYIVIDWWIRFNLNRIYRSIYRCRPVNLACNIHSSSVSVSAWLASESQISYHTLICETHKDQSRSDLKFYCPGRHSWNQHDWLKKKATITRVTQKKWSMMLLTIFWQKHFHCKLVNRSLKSSSCNSYFE